MVLIIRPDKSYYGDTTYNSQLSVYQLKNELSFPLYQTQFYNTSDFEVDPNPIGSINTLISPNNTDSVSIRLSDVMGKNLFDLFRTRDYVMQSTSNFLTYFRGLQLAPAAAGMHAVYGFHDSLIIRLHYHETTYLLKMNALILPSVINDQQTVWPWWSHYRTGTPVSVFNNAHNEVASTATNNSAFIQP